MGKRILVVEDDEATRELVALVLREAGYAVEQASDGAEALEALRRATPDLILLDKQLPRMGGTEFAAAYRALSGDHAPIVALCAALDCPDWARAIRAVTALAKPFSIEELVAVVSSTLAATAIPAPQPAAR